MPTCRFTVDGNNKSQGIKEGSNGRSIML